MAARAVSKVIVALQEDITLRRDEIVFVKELFVEISLLFEARLKEMLV